MTEIRTEIREFVVENFLFGEDGELEDDASLIAKGIVDSTGMLELISYLETHFGIEIRDEDLLPDNMDSIDRLSNFVLRKTGSGEADLSLSGEVSS
jgi:acyl carrier protein